MKLWALLLGHIKFYIKQETERARERRREIFFLSLVSLTHLLQNENSRFVFWFAENDFCMCLCAGAAAGALYCTVHVNGCKTIVKICAMYLSAVLCGWVSVYGVPMIHMARRQDICAKRWILMVRQFPYIACTTSNMIFLCFDAFHHFA